MVDPITFSVLAAIAANKMMAAKCPKGCRGNWLTQTNLPSGEVKCGSCGEVFTPKK